MGKLIVNIELEKMEGCKDRSISYKSRLSILQLITDIGYKVTNYWIWNEDRGIFFKKTVGTVQFTIEEKTKTKLDAEILVSSINHKVSREFKNLGFICTSCKWSY